MKPSIFEFTDYKIYLESWIENQPKSGRGLKSKMASSLNCNTAYVSQVLNGNAQFSPEQAEALSRFLGHLDDEKLYFNLLVQKARAGTKALRDLIDKQMNQAREQFINLKNRFPTKRTLSLQNQSIYYSAWYYSAIHIVLGIQKLQSPPSLAEYFSLSVGRVNQVLRFLVTAGLAEEKNGRYFTGPVSIHLGKDSPFISKHHMHWRMKAMEAIDNSPTPDELHYSSTITISKNELTKLQSILINAISEIRQVVKESAEEDAYCYLIDFFPLGSKFKSEN